MNSVFSLLSNSIKKKGITTLDLERNLILKKSY